MTCFPNLDSLMQKMH